MLDADSDRRLRRAVAEAGRHVALYRDLWRGANLAADPQQLPLLDKARVRAAAPAARVHDGRGARRLSSELSSGSSGEPLAIHSDSRALTARRIAFLRALIHCGYRPGHCLLLLTSRKRRHSLGSALARWHFAGIGEDTAALVKHAAKMRPQVLYGPLSTLELVARAAPRASSAPADAQVRRFRPGNSSRPSASARSSAPSACRSRISTAWRSSGSWPTVRREGRAYVPARSSLVLEYLAVPHDRAVEQLVISDLAERTSPLLRYDTGDFVRRDTTRVDRPVVEIAGRVFDCILLPNGERISPYRIDVALEDLPDLKAFRGRAAGGPLDRRYDRRGTPRGGAPAALGRGAADTRARPRHAVPDRRRRGAPPTGRHEIPAYPVARSGCAHENPLAHLRIPADRRRWQPRGGRGQRGAGPERR
jgi:phenylacetate-coenzyme A ligase PaaK-like adenylate-forming protein